MISFDKRGIRGSWHDLGGGCRSRTIICWHEEVVAILAGAALVFGIVCGG